MLIGLTVNGLDYELDVPPATSLLAVLRDTLQLTGTKNACEQGECGSCSVWLDGDVVCACLVPAAQLDGCEVRTVEGVVPGALQEALLHAGAVQCGFCMPGIVVTASDLLARERHPSEEAIRDALAGNLCRCTGYQKIVEAVKEVAR